jgi:hypothetical protein
MIPSNGKNPISDLFGFFAGLKNKEYPEFLYKNKRLSEIPVFCYHHISTAEVEAHLLDFRREIYGQELEIVFLNKLREEERFAGLAALRAQIGWPRRGSSRTLVRRRLFLEKDCYPLRFSQ